MPCRQSFLTFLDDRKYKRIGGLEDIELDVRVIAATNRNLEEMVEKNEFRSDLYYRLHVVPIHIPPLRSRKSDIPLLCGCFITRYNKEYGQHIRRVDSG